MTPTIPLVKCKTCDFGVLQKLRLYRMSGIVVVIGYIILIPSVLTVLISILAFLNLGSVPTHDSAAGAIAGGMLIAFGFVSLVGGLLGWLLVMKKDILKCNYCGAVVAAS